MHWTLTYIVILILQMKTLQIDCRRQILFMPPASSLPHKDTHTAVQNVTECGQYDFRCVDETTFQLCTYSDTESSRIDHTELIHQCGPDTVCDEDEPAFCTPKHPVFMPGVKRNSAIGNSEKRSASENQDNASGDYDDGSNSETTTTNEALILQGAGGIDCTHYGYFKGNKRYAAPYRLRFQPHFHSACILSSQIIAIALCFGCVTTTRMAKHSNCAT